MADLVPIFSGVEIYPRSAHIAPPITRPGQVVGLYIVTHPNVVDEAAARFERWFAGREEVDIVDVGTSDKMGLGVILMEWSECDVDPLFLAILNDEDAIADFTLFARTL